MKKINISKKMCVSLFGLMGSSPLMAMAPSPQGALTMVFRFSTAKTADNKFFSQSVYEKNCGLSLGRFFKSRGYVGQMPTPALAYDPLVKLAKHYKTYRCHFVFQGESPTELDNKALQWSLHEGATIVQVQMDDFAIQDYADGSRRLNASVTLPSVAVPTPVGYTGNWGVEWKPLFQKQGLGEGLGWLPYTSQPVNHVIRKGVEGQESLANRVLWAADFTMFGLALLNLTNGYKDVGRWAGVVMTATPLLVKTSQLLTGEKPTPTLENSLYQLSRSAQSSLKAYEKIQVERLKKEIQDVERQIQTMAEGLSSDQQSRLNDELSDLTNELARIQMSQNTAPLFSDQNAGGAGVPRPSKEGNSDRNTARVEKLVADFKEGLVVVGPVVWKMLGKTADFGYFWQLEKEVADQRAFYTPAPPHQEEAKAPTTPSSDTDGGYLLPQWGPAFMPL